ncbi:hypothetical protein HN51_053633 [Arachis hypogaea]|uniref:non-specific serine/threonine protein kinase n=1 Tax=Arachis hypogaea TaxID=3818 RepID=A0A444XD57_ARAHY|nr:probable LRR receptor-like serine/threonine-protein kinase At1g51880 [Arachis ipaensis]QHN76018.1 uncharacterized protein DS421_19g640310 [Arachis hypogaea]RYQ87537.1 hypothetical protein Ahy_B09g095047 isoform B [Arachis hypogaea]
MRMLMHLLFVMLGVVTSGLLVQTQLQSGFISIDCGLPEGKDYTEKSTGINYISDTNFIDSGVSKMVSNEDKITHQQQFSYLRSFPNGMRNCYKISVISGTKYLIRASFLYGNYDGLNELPQFDIHLGSNLWDTVKLTNASQSSYRELMHTPTLNYVHICLVNTGNGIPFISAIEFRNMDFNNVYKTSGATTLARLVGLDFGSFTNLTYRYMDDFHDRLWEPYSNDQWTQLHNPISNDLPSNEYELPNSVIWTAATPRNANGVSLDFYFDTLNVTTQQQCYFYLHFAEVQNLAPNETREFNITLNGEYFYNLLRPGHFVNTIFDPSPNNVFYKNNNISLVKTEASTLPPIINALEIYQVKDFSQLETQQDDVDAITNIKKVYRVTQNWQGDPCAPVAYMWEGLNCNFNGTPRITSLNLSSRGLTGYIAVYISKLNKLESLDLSNNSLIGEIPVFLVENLPWLRVLNLQNNNLTGLIPNALLQKSSEGILSLRLGQNPNLCESGPCDQQTKDKSKENNPVIYILASVSAFLMLLLVVLAAVNIIHIKKRELKDDVYIHMESGDPLESKRRQYSFDEVVNMTNNFEKVLGKGGFGTVYYGIIDNIPVAVKMLLQSSVQGYQEFLAEVKFFMRVHHRNLTSLIGYCNEDDKIGIIYEYMANGNLNEHLSGKATRKKFLTWEDRLQIAVDVAQGLEYLHSGCKPPIIHRDIKCTNILLNENFQAKLADLGLSKSFIFSGDTHVSTMVAGTPGYLDPEYQTSNKLTEKSDVYSFGVVLLKIITGEAAASSKAHNNAHISQWVGSVVARGDIERIVDPSLEGDFDIYSAWKAVEVAMACVSISSKERPYMRDVLVELKECLAVESARKNVGAKDSNELVTMNPVTEISPIAR